MSHLSYYFFLLRLVILLRIVLYDVFFSYVTVPLY